jgi:TonB family protein
MDEVSIRGEWVGQTVDGKFALLEWLGGSGTSGVFSTELDGLGSQKAAIKLIPASGLAEDRLANWASDASLSHPHLERILHFGRGTVDGAEVVYVVTELADEVLSQIIPERPLTPDETREMLGPVLDALSYLHRERLVHGHLKPSNILVIDNQVKLSADGLLRAGEHTREVPSNDIHNAPESGTVSPESSADVWSLGITVMEALTQQTPLWDAAENADPPVPASVPNPFSEIVRECVHVDPARRCTLGDVREMLEGKPTPAVSTPAPVLPERPDRRPERTARSRMPLVPLIMGLVLLVLIIIGLKIHNRKTETAPLDAEKTVQAPPAEPHAGTPLAETTPGGTQKGAALKRVMPDVSSTASNTIHGTLKVAVRVNVDATGAVTNAEFASRGPSAYFARMALESARNWTFQPPMQSGKAVASTWLLHYAFRRGGTDVTAEQKAP